MQPKSMFMVHLMFTTWRRKLLLPVKFCKWLVQWLDILLNQFFGNEVQYMKWINKVSKFDKISTNSFEYTNLINHALQSSGNLLNFWFIGMLTLYSKVYSQNFLRRKNGFKLTSCDQNHVFFDPNLLAFLISYFLREDEN